MADIFDVVADATRRDLLRFLLERSVAEDAPVDAHASRGEISVGDLVERLGVSQPTVSKHLKVLREHGLVHSREDGQHRYYRLDTGPLEELEDWLMPFLSPVQDLAGGSTVFAAWSGAEVGDRVGRATAQGLHQARSALNDASRAIQDAQEQVSRTLHDTQAKVTKRLPWLKKK